MTTQPARKTFSGRGGTRPRANVDRYPGGQIIHSHRKPKETPEEIKATVYAYRSKKGVSDAHLDDRRVENPFGRLRTTKQISGFQYRAGEKFSRIMGQWYEMNGIPNPNPAAISLEGGGKGEAFDRLDPDLAETPEEAQVVRDEIRDLKAAYTDMRRILLDLEHSAMYRGTEQLLRRVILFREDVERDERELGNLRAGLNVLARHWGMFP